MADRIDRVDAWIINDLDTLSDEQYQAATLAFNGMAAALGLRAGPAEATDRTAAEATPKPIWVTEQNMHDYALTLGLVKSPMPNHVWRTLRRHLATKLRYNDEPEENMGVDLHSLIGLVRDIQSDANPKTGKVPPIAFGRKVGRGFRDGSYRFLLGFVAKQMSTQEIARQSGQSTEK